MSRLSIERILDRVRRPEYTGKNRCPPCTVVNLIIAAAGSSIIGYVWFPAGIVGFILAVGMIYFRGYLVPGTPTLTKRYLPARLQSYFKTQQLPGNLAEYDKSSSNVDFEEFNLGHTTGEDILKEMGVIEECEDRDDICLTEHFNDAWEQQLDQLSESATSSELATLLEVEEDSLSMDSYGEAIVVDIDDTPAISWESNAAMIADLGAVSVLRAWATNWDSLDPAVKCNLAGKLRVFLETCPECNGPISEQLETVESCCSAKKTLGRRCQDCQANLFEVEFEESQPYGVDAAIP